jgi:ribosomal protein L11 methyltransferase
MDERWAEISINTTQEATEAVAAFFHELGAGGVVIEDPDLIQSYRQSGNWTDCIFPEEAAVDFVKVVAYLPMDAGLTEKLRRLATHMDELTTHALDKGRGTIAWREVREAEWADAWKTYFHTSRIGERLVVKPSWEEYQPMPGDVVIELDPGMAFGTGTHGSTILCMERLEELVKPGMTVFDVGSGSGILAVTAAKLGAAKVLALEYDAKAVEVARENVAINGLSDVIEVRQGDLLNGVTGKADLIVANIVADIILRLLPSAIGQLAPNGCFIACGIIRDRMPDVVDAMTSFGFADLKIDESGEWTSITACGRS